MFAIKTFSANLEKTTKRITFSITIKHNDNDPRKKVFLCSAIIDCLNLLTASMEVLGRICSSLPTNVMALSFSLTVI